MADYLKNLQQAVRYIEEHLTDEILLEEVSKAACLSPYHFSRLFHYHVGEPLSAYIRKRRLTEAAKDLLHSKMTIIDVAFKYRYNSHAAFTRSFKKQFLITPKKVENLSKELSFGEVKPLETDNLIHRTGGGLSLEPQIIRTEPLYLAGLRSTFKLNTTEIPRLWAGFYKLQEQIESPLDRGVYGVSIYPEQMNESNLKTFTFDYMVGRPVASPQDVPDTMTLHPIPGRTYGVFTHTGLLKDLRYTYDYIYKTWLPASGYGFFYADHYEYIAADYQGDFEDSVILVYIPLSS